MSTYRKEEVLNAVKNYSQMFPSVELLSSDDLLMMLKDNEKCKPILVDVRSQAEINISRIPGAITKEDFEKRIKTETKLKTSTIVPYCTIGYRSGEYGTKLKNEGFQNVYNGDGIISYTYSADPTNSNGCLVYESKPGVFIQTNKVHVFSDQFNLVSEHYEPVTFTWFQMIGLFAGTTN